MTDIAKLAHAVLGTYLIRDFGGCLYCAHCKEKTQVKAEESAREAQLNLAHKKDCVVVDAVRILAEKFEQRPKVK